MKYSIHRFLAYRLASLLPVLICIFTLSIAASAQAAATQPAIQDKTATIYGAKIRYLEAGNGPVVILLH
jgi:hypothetical protein